ncbi:MAG: DUF1971 domain-containing protein [Microthrixaceae bacterium]
MTDLPELPDDVQLVRTTNVFDNDTVPAGLLKAHQVAAGVWGRLVVRSGSVGFVFEDAPDQQVSVASGGALVIPPQRHHHVVLGEPATFAVEFYRASSETAERPPTESLSTGLADA